MSGQQITESVPGCPSWCTEHSVEDVGFASEFVMHEALLVNSEDVQVRVCRCTNPDGSISDPDQIRLGHSDDLTVSGAEEVLAALQSALSTLGATA